MHWTRNRIIFSAKEYLEDFQLPFQDESFNHAVSFQVLEHHKKPESMISELARIVKKGGHILITCPFIYALHEEPNDFQRLTEYKLRELFEKNNCQIMRIKKQGSLFSAITMLFAEQLNAFAAKGRLHYFLAVIIYLPFLLFQYASLFLDKLVRPDKIFINYLILSRKE